MGVSKQNPDPGSRSSRIKSGSESRIWDSFYQACDAQLLYHSRVHRLPGLDRRGTRFWVKREDESGFGISGSKKRKYASLIPWLLQNQIQLVGLIGGPRSNHVVGLLQLLRENRIVPHLFLRENHAPARGGNAFLRQLLAREGEITWISKADWPRVADIAREILQTQNLTHYLVPEGGYCEPALAGAATLLADIERNEQEKGVAFDHIFIDSGTGFTAATLLVLHHGRKRPGKVHVVLTAGNKNYFSDVVEQVYSWLESFLRAQLPKPEAVLCYAPSTAKAFGSVNQTIRRAVERYAREEGILCDPIYTAKLFLTAEEVAEKESLQGNILLVHGGGGTGLLGFGESW
jgi:1-aminocyclopropane-1-carboxylate deaminase